MAIIIDANRAGDFSHPQNGHAGEILVRISSRRMSVVLGGKLLRELAATRLRGLVIEWVKAGSAKRFEDDDIRNEELKLFHLALSSDDPHIIALASVSGARLLYTMDEALIKDFKDTAILRPKRKVVKADTDDRIARALFDQYGA